MNSASQKLGRAIFHLDALKESFRRFDNSNPYRLVQGEVTENNRRYAIVRAQVLRPIPDEFGLTVGDICNNLRSALDHLLWHFHLAKNPSFDRRVIFPMFEDEAAFKKTGSQYIRGLSPALQALFEWAQPYKRGNNLLTILRKLNDTDKHRLIPVLAVTADFISIQVSAEVFEQRGDEPVKMSVPRNQRLEDGTELIRVPLPDPMPEEGVNMKTGIHFDIVFGDIPAIASGLNVGETLTAIRDEVEVILHRFAAYRE